MDTLNAVGSNVILSNRYALLECLAVSGVGKIYRGRDLEQIKEKGLESRILVHVLPITSAAILLDAMFQQIMETRQRIGADWILAAQTYGQDGDLAYVVMESPEKWGLHSLISQSSASNPVWQVAMQRLQPLVKQKYLDASTDPALLLGLSSQEIYLLPTALSPLVQMLQNRASIRSILPHKSRRAAVAGSVLALFTLVSAVASNAIMNQVTVGMSSQPVSALVKHQPVPTRLSLVPLPQAEITADFPASAMQAELGEQVALVGEEPVLAVEAPPKQTGARIEPAQRPTVAAERVLTSEQETTLSAPPADSKPASTATGIEGIIQQAYVAMGAGRLDAGNTGALHFTRLLRGQSPRHPQVARLGQEITAAYLRQTRTALQTGNLADAGRLLPTSRQLIQEFGLRNLEPAQQVLEEKVAQLNSY